MFPHIIQGCDRLHGMQQTFGRGTVQATHWGFNTSGDTGGADSHGKEPAEKRQHGDRRHSILLRIRFNRILQDCVPPGDGDDDA